MQKMEVFTMAKKIGPIKGPLGVGYYPAGSNAARRKSNGGKGD
jgi:hypothetical protein